MERIHKKGKELRKSYLLDMHKDKIEGNNEKAEVRLKKITKSMGKSETRNKRFKYMNETLGKGPNSFLKRLHKVDINGNIYKTLLDRISIENELINYNTNYLKEVKTSKVCQDKIHNKLMQ